MAIKRYFADADNTITNAYEENLTTRGTGSNMGRADILEVFSLYGQESSTSSELTRFLIKFPITDLSTDRTNGNLPASGSVSFYLKLSNAKHAGTLPEGFVLDIKAVSGSWQEGVGLDMENYSDLTYDKIGSNWICANGNLKAATATIVISDSGGISHGDTFTLVDSVGTSTVYTINGGVAPASGGGAGGIAVVGFLGIGGGDAGKTAAAASIVIAINATTDANYTSVSDGVNTVTITQGTSGRAGNRTNEESIAHTTVSSFTGGDGEWVSEGGDYYTDSSSSFTQTFDVGTENLEVDITTLVEQWINSAGNAAVLGVKDNHGFGIHLSSSYEASSSTNPNGAVISYYTKKFFARSSEYFFERPVLEARWDSARRDNRGNCYISSSLAPAEDNLNTLFMYNYIRGQLKDIGGSETAIPVLNFYYSSGSVPEGDPRGFLDSSNIAVTHLSSSRVSKGIYKTQFAATSSIKTSTYPYLVDVWTMSGSQLHTGSAIDLKSFAMSNHNPSGRYVVAMPNLKKVYMKGQTERFRLFVRYKDWSPNVYTKANSTIETLLIPSASYQLTRVVDDKVIIPYGTGSDSATMLSYDVSGNYFDLDLNMLEGGYIYGLKYSFYEDSNSSYVEQPFLFKIRVEKDEY